MRLGGDHHDLPHALVAEGRGARDGGVEAALALAIRVQDALPLPGEGDTLRLWECLATLAAVDLQVSRVVEPHLDARAILAEAGRSSPEGSTWGVFAAEGAGHRLRARRAGEGWVLDGVKPWCSLATHLSHALVTAWVDERRRCLFGVALTEGGVDADPGTWQARGLRDITSSPVTFRDVPAWPVGEPDWYLTRPGFAWGGIGVAAVWYGGAVAVARRVAAASATREPDQIALMHLGDLDVALTTGRNALAGAAAAVDSGRAAQEEGALQALRVRRVVFDAAELVLHTADHALGPAPLVGEGDYAAHVADLHLYLRQHHAERDSAALGRHVLRARPW